MIAYTEFNYRESTETYRDDLDSDYWINYRVEILNESMEVEEVAELEEIELVPDQKLYLAHFITFLSEQLQKLIPDDAHDCMFQIYMLSVF